MLVERSYMEIRDGLADAFADAMTARGLPLLASIGGVEAVRLGRGVERPDTFILLVEWRSMDDHVAFTKLPAFGEFRALVSPFTRGGGMEHFEMLPTV